jgi:hypothetical protein
MYNVNITNKYDENNVVFSMTVENTVIESKNDLSYSAPEFFNTEKQVNLPDGEVYEGERKIGQIIDGWFMGTGRLMQFLYMKEQEENHRFSVEYTDRYENMAIQAGFPC